MSNPQKTAERKQGEPTAPPETVTPPAEGGKERRHSVFHLLKVAKLDRITDDAVAITFEVPDRLSDEFTFQAGQHVSVRATIAGDDVRRSYSICTPATSGILRVGVKGLPDGVFSSFALNRLQVGDSLEVLTPSGRFTTALDPTRPRHYGAVAAGSGITPVLSILSTALEVEPGSRATLIYLNRATTSIMFIEELEDLKNRYLERFQAVHVLDGERQDVELLSGALDQERLNRILDGLVTGDVDDWFLCGPQGLTDLVRDVLVARGHDPDRVHRELFVAASPAPRTPRPPAPGGPELKGSAVEVVLDGRSTTFTLPPGGESILDAALKLRGDAPYACKNGVCGTCRARVVDGRVEMDQNYALEHDEVERGFVLACQAHPVTDRVTIDFDQ
jgi:ring-1,2-phenylacetyl-CoA epoxidase subunit PaaE